MRDGARRSDSLQDLAARRDALRQAARVPGADPGALLEAALTEVDAALDALASAAPGDAGPGEAGAASVPESVRAERRLLHAAFQEAPVPLFLLEADGTIRRANNRAARLLGAPAGYATGKPLTVFVDLPLRAAVGSQLAAVARTGQPRGSGCRLLTTAGTADGVLEAAAIELPGEPPLLVVTVMPPDPQGTPGPQGTPRAAPGPGTGAGREGFAGTAPVTEPDRIREMVRRGDMLTSVTRLLLDNATFSEAVTLQRCARLLAAEIADWVIVDVERDGRLRRQYATGPRGSRQEQAARAVRRTDPAPSSLPCRVHAAARSALVTLIDDPALLGTGPDGTPLALLLGVTSVVCVPVTDGADCYGALTLARGAGRGPFEIADLALAEDLGGHLAASMRVDRMFRRRSEQAEALQASLLPARLPEVPGLEFAAAYIGATQWPETSGDFYDVFRAHDGWAVAIGDVCGKGQDAAAMTAAARHAIRALSHVSRGRARSHPADVLASANEVLLAGAEDDDERFVTAKLAFLTPREPHRGERRGAGRRVRVRIGSAGHPGPAVVRADGRVEMLEGDGLPLGLFGDAEPMRSELELREGDLLFFYTDGVTEARGAGTGEGFFEDRLADELAAVAGQSAAETVRAVTELLTDFSGGEFRDDVTILAMKVTAG
jgi:serine phosphatase RsbU (regulator of sigma subunit)/PAS domain-containing protein